LLSGVVPKRAAPLLLLIRPHDFRGKPDSPFPDRAL